MRKTLAIALVLALAAGLLPRQAAYADSACNVAISPDIVSPGTESVLQFDIQNTGFDAALWVQVRRPTASYSVNGITQSGWIDATDDTGTLLTSGTIGAGDTLSLQLALFTAPQEEGASPWDISVSSNSDGSNAVACSGQLSTTIGSPPQPPSPNGESNIGLTAITATSATIAWTSDTSSTSYVYYGLTSGYGSIATASGSTVGHTVTLNNLSPNTIYHYMVAGSDGNGNNYFSGDNTFITPAAPPPVQPIVITGGGTGGTAAANLPKVPGDKTAPAVTLDTALNHPFTTAPLIRGSASDNGALAQIQYSTDGGRNWLPVNSVTGLGSGRATFSFTPITPEDGNYSLVVGAWFSSRPKSTATMPFLPIRRDRR